MRCDSAIELREKGRQLMLSNRTMEEYTRRARPKQADFLLELFDFELAYRDENRRHRLKKRACFPTIKSFDDYDWSCAKLPGTITKADIEECSFISKRENLICYGPVGLGKTHLAIAIGNRACELGCRIRFITAAELVLKLKSAKETGTLDKLLNDYASNDATILDEWGYVPVDSDGARLLFQVISRCYETRSLIITTNLEFSRWGGVLTDEQMASAMIDRLLHHGHVITFSGKSYRLSHALMNENR